jgi:hypothetical protein
MSNLADIVTVNIDIATPAVDSASFDNLLIFGPPPAIQPTKPLPIVGAYTDLSEVTGAGYVSTGADADPIGIAARIAFSQNPKPSKLYIAAQRETPPLISGAVVEIITPNNAQTDAIPIGTVQPDNDTLPWLQITYNRKAVSLMEVEIEKDGVTVYGNSLPTEADETALLQVMLGVGEDGEDAMNLQPEDFIGSYTVTLTSTLGSKATTITRSLTFNGTTGSAATGTDVTTPTLQTPVETLSEALETTGWYVACAAGIDESGFEEIAEFIEAQYKQFAYSYLAQEDPVGAIYYRSHGWCGLEYDDQDPADAPQSSRYLHVAATAKSLSYPSGSETWAFKQLASVYPSDISSTLRKAIAEEHSNYFAQYAGRNITMNGQVRAGEWIDVIRGRDWLQNDMQLRIFNLLLMNPKIPYTNSGIALVENQMIASLKAAQTRGIVAENEYDEDEVLIPGFVTHVPNSATLTASQKASRVLTDCTFSARLAGAIHAVRVNGSLTY